MTLKVIGAGLGRTGTLSLKLALEQLGFGPCYHMIEVFADIDRKLPQWTAVTAGKPDWDTLFDGYAATVDYPACRYWQALSDHFPDAKVILTVRDAQSWFESVSSTIFADGMRAMMADSPLASFFGDAVVHDFGDRIGDRDFMVDYFERHTAEVIASLPAERLLVFSARDGWEPLCAFLGVPVPDAPYPRINSREEMHERGMATGAMTTQAIQTMARGFLAATRGAALV